MKYQDDKRIISLASSPETGTGNHDGHGTIRSPMTDRKPWLHMEPIRPGMSLILYDFTPREDFCSPFEVGERSFGFATVLSWQSEEQDRRDSRRRRLEVKQPCDIIGTTDNRAGDIRFKKGQRQCYVALVMRMDVLREFLSHDEHYDRGIFSRLKKPHELGIVDKRVASPQTQLIANQILSLPFQGACGRIFLEGKALEYLSFGLNQLKQNGKPFSVSLSRSDVERLREARRILLADLTEPPTIRQLARRTGLNEFKLKKGFHELFGCTVYNCLRARRMDTARTMLLDSDMTVGTAAAMVGYTNISHFITAFRKQFGVTPGSLLYHSRRNHTPTT